MQQVASPVLDGLMLAVTNLASEQAYLVLLVIIDLAVDGSLGRRLGIVLMLSILLNSHLKGIIDTPRPFMIDPNVARSEAAVATAGGAGFPSGHAQSSATLWGYLAQHVPRRWFRALAGMLVTLISLSRIYLGVHLPIDVVAGLAIAGVVLMVASVVDRHAARLVPRWPRPLLFLLGVVVPLVMHRVWPVPYSALLMGGLAAFLTAPALIPYDLPATVPHRSRNRSRRGGRRCGEQPPARCVHRGVLTVKIRRSSVGLGWPPGSPSVLLRRPGSQSENAIAQADA